jgi:hypothetical protein
MKQDETRAGAVVVFGPGITTEQAHQILGRIAALESFTVETFDPRIGGPVWYVP